MATEKAYKTYQEFWPFYLREHSHAGNRWLHFIGTSIGFSLLIQFVLTSSWKFLFGAFFIGYAFAWVGHFKIEKNRPATFTYPLWSFISDWRMWFLMIANRLDGEIEKANELWESKSKNLTS